MLSFTKMTIKPFAVLYKWRLIHLPSFTNDDYAICRPWPSAVRLHRLQWGQRAAAWRLENRTGTKPAYLQLPGNNNIFIHPSGKLDFLHQPLLLKRIGGLLMSRHVLRLQSVRMTGSKHPLCRLQTTMARTDRFQSFLTSCKKIHTFWFVSRFSKVGETSEGRDGTHMSFTKRLHIILNWTR